MDGIYDIQLGKEKIGKCVVSREGLYYCFRCCCDLTGSVIFRIMVKCGSRTESLGIPVPAMDAFYLTKRLPISRFGEDEPEIYLVPRHPIEQDRWIQVKPDEPFGYLKELKNAVLEIRDGVMGLHIKSSDPAPLDSDPNP